MLPHPLRRALRVIALLLCVAVGVLDHQAFRWVPILQSFYFSGVGHALLLFATGLLAGVLLRSWWAIVLAPLAYVVGFEAAIEVVSGSLGGFTDVQHLLWLLITASGPALPLALGAALATAVMKRWLPSGRRRPRTRSGPPTGGRAGGPQTGTRTPHAGHAPGRAPELPPWQALSTRHILPRGS